MPVVILPIRLIYGFRSRSIVCVLNEKSDAQANLTVKIDILLDNARSEIDNYPSFSACLFLFRNFFLNSHAE